MHADYCHVHVSCVPVMRCVHTGCLPALQAEVNQGLQEGLEVLKQQKALAEALAQGRGEEMQGLKLQVKDLTGRLTEAEDRVQQGELIRRKLHNTILVGTAISVLWLLPTCSFSSCLLLQPDLSCCR